MPTDALIHPEIERYIDAMWMEKGLSDNSLSSYRRDLRQFHDWLVKNKDSSILRADRSSLQAYLGARLKQGQSPRSTAPTVCRPMIRDSSASSRTTRPAAACGIANARAADGRARARQIPQTGDRPDPSESKPSPSCELA
jgi:hypothetical protein